jgi:pilus assembly protein CpaB
MRYAILVVVGLVLAVGVAMMLKTPKTDTPEEDGNKVLVAKVDLQPGTFIVVANHIDFVAMKDSEIQPNYLQKKNVNLADINGAVIRNLIKAGEPLQKEKIVTPKEGGFLSAVLYPGTRAISVGVDVVSANAGFIFPGDRVDLLLTHSVDQGDGKKSFASETFLEDIRVLAIDQQVNNPENKALVPKTVTLEVTPKQAEKVLVAQQLGKIALILRSSGSVTFNDITNVESQTYTRDSEVSKILSGGGGDVDVTITRGKASTETKVNGNIPVTPQQVITPTNPGQVIPQPGTAR